MIPLAFIESNAGFPVYRLDLKRLQQLLPGDAGLDTICDGILRGTPFVLGKPDVPTRQPELVAR
jgi:hypothetical protein